MKWIAVLRAVVSFLAEVSAMARERQLIKAGRAEALASVFEEAADALSKARVIEAQLRDEFAARPDSVFDNDGYRRD